MKRDDTSTDIQEDRCLNARILYMNQSHKAKIKNVKREGSQRILFRPKTTQK